MGFFKTSIMKELYIYDQFHRMYVTGIIINSNFSIIVKHSENIVDCMKTENPNIAISIMNLLNTKSTVGLGKQDIRYVVKYI